MHKLGQIWVEGQITQISRRPRSRVAFITLRDPAADMSVQVTCNPDLLDRAPVPLTEGSRVVMLGRPTFYTGRATLSLRVSDIRPVGIGELLARIEGCGSCSPPRDCSIRDSSNHCRSCRRRSA